MDDIDLEQLIVGEAERTRKYFDALAEKLARLEARQDLLDAHVLSAESRVAGIDVHVANAEKVQKVVLTEVRGLATKVDRLSRTRGRGRTEN